MNRFVILAAFTCVASALAMAADAPRGPSKDVPELQILNHWVGKWDVEMTISPNDNSPNGTRAKGTATAEWVLDGRFVQETWTMNLGDGSPPMKGTSLMTYDPRRKVYRTWMFFSSGGITESEGRWDEKSRTLTSTGRDPHSGVATTIKAKFAEDGSQSWNIVEKDRAGKALGEVAGTNTARKG